MKVAIVRGKFLNQYEMQSFAPLAGRYKLSAFGSLHPFHNSFPFPVINLPSPMDIPEFPYKMPILNRLFTDAHYLLGLEKQLRGFDLVHTAETYYRYTQQALAAKRKRYVKKVIATVLENIPHNNEGIWGRKESKARARKELDHVIALTQGAKAALIEEGCDPKKITVIGHGIDIARFKPVKRKPQKKLTVLFCGRLEEYKGIFDLLSAVHVIHEDIRLLIVGDGTQKRNLLHTIHEWGMDRMVQLTQSSYEDMPKAYQQADIFVAPSRAQKNSRGKVTWLEQYGTVFLEAQAAGLPIITTWSGAIPENVGEAALLVPPGDAAAVAFALRRLIDDRELRDAYGAKARKRAETVHDARRIAGRIASVYERVMLQ